MVLTYNDAKETFENGGCKLLTTEEEFNFNKMNSKSKYNIISSCGHIFYNCWYSMFNHRKTGVICKSCINSNRSKFNTELNKNIEGNSYALNIEYESVKVLKKYIDSTFIDIKMSPECCLADLCIRDINCIENNWLPIQLKSTIKAKGNIYSFGLSRNYHNMVIIFICIEEEKFWFINGNNILNKLCLSIGINTSKYDVYQVDKNKVTQKLLEFYTTLKKNTLENIQIPLSKNCQKEQEFRKLRETKLNNVEFNYPELNQCIFDFKVNNFKIQEKTAFNKNPRNYNIVMFTKSKNGLHNPYEHGDNDFYWINLPDHQTFYIIPEQVLVDKQIISTETKKGTKYLSFAKTNKWVNDYRYSYDEYNINEIINFYFNVHKK
jgi:hypothetical protein